MLNKPEIKLLIVDDREDNLMSIESILERDDYIIRKANSGRAALKILLKEHDFALILMDVQMPDLNGFETAMIISERDKLKHIPIIFITAHDYGEENIFKGYQMGGVDYIYKPINPGLLRAKVSVFSELYMKTHQLMAQEQKLIHSNKLLAKEVEERKVSEEKVRLLNGQLMDNIFQLEAMNADLERFAYIASHDLQEPLRKIIIFGGRLASKYEEGLDEEGRDMIDRMVKASKRMQALIRNILSFSRAFAEEREPYEQTDLNKLIDGIRLDIQLYIEQKKAVFEIGQLPSLRCIPGQIRQVFQNLIINALKFDKPGVAPVITITGEVMKGKQLSRIPQELHQHDFVRIVVADNGIGFDQKYAEQIFQIFKRLHSFDHIEGTGIGLSICKKVVENHDGYISANGRLNEGATFHIILPTHELAVHAASPTIPELSKVV